MTDQDRKPREPNQLTPEQNPTVAEAFNLDPTKPPPLPQPFVKHWEDVVEPTRTSERTKRALRWWLAGYSWAEVAEIMGYASPDCRSLRRAARGLGLTALAARSDNLIRQSRAIAQAAGEKILERIEDGDDSMSAKELAIVRGIEIDKVAKRERWDRGAAGEEGTFLSGLESIAEELAKSGGKLELTVTKSDPADAAIDVTPED